MKRYHLIQLVRPLWGIQRAFAEIRDQIHHLIRMNLSKMAMDSIRKCSSYLILYRVEFTENIRPRWEFFSIGRIN